MDFFTVKKNDGHFAKLVDEVRRRQGEGRNKKDLKKCEGQDEKGTCGQLPKHMVTTLMNSEIYTSLSHDEVLENKSADAEGCENPKLNEDEDNREEYMPCSINNSTQWRENAMINNKNKNEGRNSSELNREEILGTSDIEVKGSMYTDLVDGNSTMDSIHQSQENKGLKSMEEKCPSEYFGDGLIPENKQSDEKPVDPSPDIFLGSPLSSDGSGDSVSLLKDCDPLTPPQLASLSGQHQFACLLIMRLPFYILLLVKPC